MNMPGKKTQVEKEARVAEEYLSSLSDLNCNSKPLINMLTMLAEENIEFAAVIVKVVENHILKVQADVKLPILYLIDSIVKNVKSTYVQLFSQCIVNIFCGVFEKVNEKVRERMYALRQTWNEVFLSQKLYALDVKVKNIDNNWPITAKTPLPSIHVNPNFLKTVPAIPTDMEEILQVKTRELLELRKRKLELELEATKKHLEEQEKQLTKTTENIAAAGAVPVGGMHAAQQMPPQMMAAGGMVRAGLIAGAHPHMHPGIGAPAAGLRPPAMYHNNNFRAPRPQQHPGGMLAMQTQSYPPNNNNMNKPKVHPVSPVLVNTMRHRDPRVARQLQQQQQQQQQLQNVPTSRGGTGGSSRTEDSKTDERSKSSSSNYRINKSRSGSAGSESKTSSSSYGRFSGRSSKSSSTSSRDKDKDHNRSESKSSTTSSSSTGSISSTTERRKNGGSSSSRNKTSANAASSTSSSKCDKDAFEIAPLSTAFKRKSTSPPGSPIKSRDAKRSMKSRNCGSNSDNITPSRSRSRSPVAVADIDSTKDIDLRTVAPIVTSSSIISSSTVSPVKHPKQRRQTTDSAEHVIIEKDSDKSRTTKLMDGGTKDLDKNIKIVLEPPVPISSSMDVDLRLLQPMSCTSSSIVTVLNYEQNVDPEATCAKNNTVATSTATTSSPKVSFKIQRMINKLEKSTEHLSTVASTTTANDPVNDTTVNVHLLSPKSNPDGDVKMETEKTTIGGHPQQEHGRADELMIIENDAVADDISDTDGKKRPSPKAETEEPLPKKSKSAKFDALFGSEDVDLRTVMPPQIMIARKQAVTSGVLTPPPPKISAENDDQNAAQKSQPKTVENWDNLKTTGNTSTSTSLKASQPKKISSLDDVRAKLAKAAKYNNKLGKFEKSNKELAQRLKLDELHMNEDSQEANEEKIRILITQAQDMLDTKSIGQEQYNSLMQTVMSINESSKLRAAKRIAEASKASENDDNAIEAERLAKRDAILKKRIPKLSKQNQIDNRSLEAHLSDSANSGDSPIYENRKKSNDDAAPPVAASSKSKSSRDKRVKPSKWSERVDTPINVPAGNSTVVPPAPLPQRNWLPNKRGGYRGNIPHPPLPPLINSNLRQQPQMPPWQMQQQNSVMIPMPFAHNAAMLHSGGGNVPPPPRPPAAVLPVIPKPCNSIDNPRADVVRSIAIDGLTKEIRVYDQVAIVFMETDQPREIVFQAGQRSIVIDNGEPITLQFNADYKPYTIDSETHRMRFGFPSRELYIDEHWYEIYFGGPPVSIPIKNKIHILKAEGPPPQVNIGALRLDLVVGKINMIVDALLVIPLFLDARQQTFRVGEEEHVIQFADKLLTVLLDEEPYSVEYGGLPKSFTLAGKKYFIRFSALPQGVTVGMVNIKDMRYVKTQPPPAAESIESESVVTTTTKELTAEATSQPISDAHSEQVSSLTATSTEPVSVEVVAPATASSTTTSITGVLPTATLNNINIDELFQKLVSSGILGSSTSILPVAGDKIAAADKSTNVSKRSNATTKSSSEITAAATPAETVPPIRPIDLTNSETIKTRQAAIVATLFSGMQCSSCGVRFPPEQTIKYSQHLDWHFRQNRRERDSSRKVHSRKWYYDLNEWMQYEEIEDLEEREKNFFETQQNEMDIVDDTSNQRSTNSPVPSCAALPEDVDRTCDMCQEKFEQFYNEDLEEWHLRSAIRVEDKIYHPLCYADYKTSLNPPKPELKEEDEKMIDTEDNNAVDIVIKIEGDEKSDAEGGSGGKSLVTIEDDDDDVIVLPNEEPSVTEIVDDDEDEYVPIIVTQEEIEVKSDDIKTAENGSGGVGGDVNDTMESDVEIQEPNIPFTDLDTYEEKEFAEGDETSQMSFMNMKIKEEPKDEEDEDDGFEDVGTVHNIPDEEISIQSSEETQTHTIVSDASPLSATERPPSSTSLIQLLDNTESSEASALATTAAPSATAAATTTIDDHNNISIDRNIDAVDEHNLSTAGPAPAVPLASLVNKIKINITKNIVSTNNSSSSSTTTTSATTSNASASNSLNCNLGPNNNNNSNYIPTVVSTIPVLCGGGTISTIVSSSSSMSKPPSNGGNAATASAKNDHSGINSNVSSISVIGSSYGSTPIPNKTYYRPADIPAPAKAPATSVPPRQPTPPAEEQILYELKPTLQKAALKKMQKVKCGVETSGLCSIM